MLRSLGDQQGAHTTATANIDRMLDPRGGVLQVIVDDLGEAITIRAEEHCIAGFGGERRMHQQHFVQAGPADAAGQQLAARYKHLSPFEQL
ncbi:hypothetical protein D3C76_745920 [compost metagenome]